MFDKIDYIVTTIILIFSASYYHIIWNLCYYFRDEIEEYYDSHRDEYEEEFERAEYRIRRTLLEEKKSTREEEITAELRNQIPVQVFEDNLKEI